MLREGLKSIDPSISFDFVDFLSQAQLEGSGWDASATRSIKNHFGIQWKIRRPDKEATKSVPFLRNFYWKQRGKTFFIEDYDENRPQNKGWLQLYFGNDVDLWVFIWRSHIEELRFLQIYNNEKDAWLKKIIELDKLKQYKRFSRHPEEKDGIIRYVGGFIIELADVRDFLAYETETKVELPPIFNPLHRTEPKTASKQILLWTDDELSNGVKRDRFIWEELE